MGGNHTTVVSLWLIVALDRTEASLQTVCLALVTALSAPDGLL